jgi:hypothetical protein
MNNYIVDTNPFSLAGPPKYFLRQLWEFDNSLVVIPSRQGWYYRLAQRKRLNLPEHIVNDALFNDSDTKMLARHSLVPVTTILATVNWFNPFLIEELRRRSPTRLGGADAVNKMLEDQDRRDDAAKDAKIDDATTIMAKDGWGMYQKKIGVRSHMYIPKTAKKKPSTPSSPLIIIK